MPADLTIAQEPFGAGRTNYANATTPTITAGAGAGTGPTLTLTSNSSSFGGTINLTTGSSTTSSAVVATIAFSPPLNRIAGVTISPGNAAAANLAVASCPYVVPTSAGFTINSSGAAMTASTAFVYNYTVNT